MIFTFIRKCVIDIVIMVIHTKEMPTIEREFAGQDISEIFHGLIETV